MSLYSGAVPIKCYSILLHMHTQTHAHIMMHLCPSSTFGTSVLNAPCLYKTRTLQQPCWALACTWGAVLCCVVVKGEASITQSHNHQSRRNAKSQSVAVAAETLHVTWKSNRGLRAMTPCGGEDNSPAALWGELMTASAPGLLLRMGVIKVDRRLPALMAM